MAQSVISYLCAGKENGTKWIWIFDNNKNNRYKMGFNDFISKLFGNKATRDMKEIQPWVEKVKSGKY